MSLRVWVSEVGFRGAGLQGFRWWFPGGGGGECRIQGAWFWGFRCLVQVVFSLQGFGNAKFKIPGCTAAEESRVQGFNGFQWCGRDPVPKRGFPKIGDPTIVP